ncbi:cation diffusion facilitator family transporter [Sediminicola luteus]|uniref:Cation transporter n=1 Tax=Sediminicola luteus TaxID=319238 RepID=A0A2A4GCB6_9FLAO|nr:cation diffusion facilitator family transporter [Sediminicola luteus]PCE66599.1 cation transporter [Sediminicola luteus]
MSHTDHHHHHSHSKYLLFTILLNMVITVAQVSGGLWSGSLALLSDALHNFSDVLSLVISYVAEKLAKRKSTRTKTFGYKRAGILAAFINAATLLIVALILIKEAIERFLEPQFIDSTWVIWLSVVAIVGNGLSVFLLHDGADKNLNMKSAYLHLLTDMLASVAVLVGGLLMKYLGWFWVDPVLTLAIALYLIYVGYQLLVSATKILMLFSPEHIDINQLVKKITALDGVANIHHIHLWPLNEDELHLEAHIEMDIDCPISQLNALHAKISNLLLVDYGINHVTLQPEYGREGDKNIIVQD